METKNKGYHLTASISNFQISYDDVGEGKIPIFFLHGFPFDKTMWQPQIYFLQASFRSIACDIRGFGRSKDEKSVLGIDLFADDLIALMDYLGIDKAVVCGLSMGGYIALNAVKRYPDRFRGLILCDTQCIADSIEAKAKRYQAIDEIENEGPENFIDRFIKSIFCKDSLTSKKEMVEQLKKVISSNSRHILTHGLKALAARDETCTSLEDINMPTLIICGREDELTPVARSEFMHTNIKGSILRIIENAGHISNLEQAEAFNGHLHDFMIGIDHLNF